LIGGAPGGVQKSLSRKSPQSLIELIFTPFMIL